MGDAPALRLKYAVLAPNGKLRLYEPLGGSGAPPHPKTTTTTTATTAAAAAEAEEEEQRRQQRSRRGGAPSSSSSASSVPALEPRRGKQSMVLQGAGVQPLWAEELTADECELDYEVTCMLLHRVACS